MYLTRSELLQKGFRHVGKDVQISEHASIYSPENISIGDNVRIDDFSILSAGEEIIIGNWVHIACHTVLIGAALIELKDFSGVSMRCTILSSNADYSGYYLTNPNIPEKYLNTLKAPVVLDKHSLVGTGSTILPGVSLGMGAIVGAMSFVKRSIPEFEVWAGSPARFLYMREQKVKLLEKQLKYENR